MDFKKALKDFWYGKPHTAEEGGRRLGENYLPKTGIYKHREWRGVKDTFFDYTQWLNNLLSMVQMVASAPIPCLKGFWEYRWMGSYPCHSGSKRSNFLSIFSIALSTNFSFIFTSLPVFF